MGKLVGVSVLAILIIVVIGCGGDETSPPSPEVTATGEAGAEMPDNVDSEPEVSRPMEQLHFLRPEGESTEVCELLSVSKLRELMPVDDERYGQAVEIHPRPEPEESPSGVKQVGCAYVDQFEKIWLSLGFAELDDTAAELVSSEEQREGLRTWSPVEVAGFDGYYTPGISDLAYTAQLLLQVGDHVFALAPYNTAGAPGAEGVSATEGEAPPWVQEVSEEVATEVLK